MTVLLKEMKPPPILKGFGRSPNTSSATLKIETNTDEHTQKSHYFYEHLHGFAQAELTDLWLSIERDRKAVRCLTYIKHKTQNDRIS